MGLSDYVQFDGGLHECDVQLVACQMMSHHVLLELRDSSRCPQLELRDNSQCPQPYGLPAAASNRPNVSMDRETGSRNCSTQNRSMVVCCILHAVHTQEYCSTGVLLDRISFT